jgi:outer membrane protein assembly factor BamA
MSENTPILKTKFSQLKFILLLAAFISSCTVSKDFPKGKPFVFKNNIEIKGGNLTTEYKNTLKARLNSQLDDSSKVNTKDILFLLHNVKKPAVYDSAATGRSVRNMEATLLHMGYYNALVRYSTDTSKNRRPVLSFRFAAGKFPFYNVTENRVITNYMVNINKPTLIDTVSYRLQKQALQQLALQEINKSLLQKNNLVSKTAVLGEIGRLVELFRNNGYYKFTSDELKVRGDSSLDILTNISDDPFEQIQALADAQAKRDSPKVKLQIVLIPPKDSTKIEKYYINNVYILPDYFSGDRYSDSSLTEFITPFSNYRIRFHNRLFNSSFLTSTVFLRKGDVYRQDDYYKTLNGLSKAGVWQSVNIIVNELKKINKTDSNKLDMIIQLIPGYKFNFQASLEASYSATSNNNTAVVAGAGNLIGLSGNVSFLNRNLGKKGIKMTNTLSSGIEFNKNKSGQSSNNNIINSNEASYSLSIGFPKLLFPFNHLGSKNSSIRQTNINTGITFVNRINLFNQQTVKFNLAYNYSPRPGRQWIFKLPNIEFSKLYNRSIGFDTTLDRNPFLRYSFNNALVAGLINIGYTSKFTNPKNSKKQHGLKFNLEESGLVLGRFGIFKKYLRQFVKTDVEYSYSRSFPKSAIVTRLFAGFGIPCSKEDTTLPFFKQYFGGGSNSMRGWPVRGIGRGSQPLAPYDKNTFNDRTGDIQFEGNFEFRHDIIPLIPNTLTLRGALFADIGNVWNMKKTKITGADSAQFILKNLYKDLGVSAGYGFRLDFNYFVLRFDFGFRFKRPEDRYNGNNGWKVPALGFNDAFQKIFTRGTNEEFRKWRYENFNLTIGIGYSFN